MQTIPAKSIITRVKSESWFGLDYNMNIYRGCNHGCIYCDSRSTCYQIDSFDQVRAKANVLKIIENELVKKKIKGVIGTGAMSDPYNIFEKKYELTRSALKLIDKYRFGIEIATKSNLIERDVDVLKQIATHSPVIVNISITTADDEISKKVEPNVSLSSERFSAIKALSDNGIYTGVLMMPILPFIEDNPENITSIICKARESGAKYVFGSMGTTKRAGSQEYYYKKLDEKFPGIKEKYIRTYANRYNCPSPKSKELWYILNKECQRLGLLYKMKDIVADYKQSYKKPEQLSLF